MQSYTKSGNYSNIIWDWNGTLLDDAWLCVEVMSEMLREHDLPVVDLDKYREIFDFPVKDYYKKLGFDFLKESFEIVGMEFMVRYNRRQKECHLHPEVPEVLTALKNRGYLQYILSAREHNELIQEVSDLGLSDFFRQIYGTGDHYAHGKKDLGIQLLSDLGIPKKEALFVGDTLHDAEVAMAMGVDCVLIPNGHHHPTRLENSGFPVVDSLTSLLQIL